MPERWIRVLDDMSPLFEAREAAIMSPRGLAAAEIWYGNNWSAKIRDQPIHRDMVRAAFRCHQDRAYAIDSPNATVIGTLPQSPSKKGGACNV